jgi:hypothetical protein
MTKDDDDDTQGYLAAQPKREWVQLTNEEIEELWGSPIEQEAFPELHFKWVRTIEAKLKEKNT